jgi:hypothetical protein
MTRVDSTESTIVVPVGPMNTDAIEHYDQLFNGVRNKVEAIRPRGDDEQAAFDDWLDCQWRVDP